MPYRDPLEGEKDLVVGGEDRLRRKLVAGKRGVEGTFSQQPLYSL
jgi:hypothetical protein